MQILSKQEVALARAWMSFFLRVLLALLFGGAMPLLYSAGNTLLRNRAARLRRELAHQQRRDFQDRQTTLAAPVVALGGRVLWGTWPDVFCSRDGWHCVVPRNRLKRTGVDLSGRPITDRALSCLDGLPMLAELNLNDTKITDAGLLQLTKFKNLQRLGVCRTQVSSASVVRMRRALLRCEIIFSASWPGQEHEIRAADARKREATAEPLDLSTYQLLYGQSPAAGDTFVLGKQTEEDFHRWICEQYGH